MSEKETKIEHTRTYDKMESRPFLHEKTIFTLRLLCARVFANSKILDCNQTIGIPISFSVEGHPKRIHVTKDEAAYEERTTRREK